MVGLVDIIKTELKKEPKKLHGQEISSRLEKSPKRKPLARAHMRCSTKVSKRWEEMSPKSMLSMAGEDGTSSRRLLQEPVQSSVRLSLKPLSPG